MIKTVFYVDNENPVGFKISGHSGYSEIGSDIICASVSSCAYMVANTITDVLNLNPDIKLSDGLLKLKLSSKDAKVAKAILDGFSLHMKTLAEDYPEYILCQTLRVKTKE